MEVTFLLALAAGIVAFASPCFLPIVPVYLGYLVGSMPDEFARTRAARRAAVTQSLAFVAGFTAVFVTLWASIGLVGYAVGDLRGPLRVVGGAVLVLMGLHVAGLVEIPLLGRQVGVSTGRLLGAGPGGIDVAALTPSYRRSALLGLAFGAGWTPCIGPILGGVIGLASVSGTVFQGAGLLLTFSLGLGIPFVLVAAGAGQVTTHLRRLRRHETAVALLTGGLLVLTGFLMITGLLDRVAALTPTLL
ncbi:cytochrome c biogenesis CcdA family protein [Mobilicoccus pelagius]|uniref:Cytochrome c-type biogenesis protein CcdA n=1 Tax=Mobilicoccus pelagius NBRC 104925 TaxID=1089455 RepID=H5US89_9MICO|nr:cytochrome c biogenesis protein CcdA [Mobilicoccus pelagius]GAB48597.1 cytochrome c-type biogenesis protein CcdA [Mobilicoccus pelagius NBRC 104925]